MTSENTVLLLLHVDATKPARKISGAENSLTGKSESGQKERGTKEGVPSPSLRVRMKVVGKFKEESDSRPCCASSNARCLFLPNAFGTSLLLWAVRKR